MKLHLTYLILAVFLSIEPIAALAQPYVQLQGKAQGTRYHISYLPSPQLVPAEAFDSILKAVDHSLSLYDTTSLICAFNKSLKGIRADIHLLRVVRSAISFSTSSHGAFDITVKPIMDAWGFGMKSIPHPPSNSLLNHIRTHVGYQHLYIQHDSVLKDNPSVQIDCNGIAQGYTVDLLAQRLEASGVSNYMVELGGEIRLRGLNPSGLPWIVGIESLDEKGGMNVDKSIQPGRGAVTTSGNYRNTRLIGRQHVGHVMDPRTAKPVKGHIVSVTVVAQDAMTADAIDHTCMVLGVEAAVQWISGMQDVSLRILYQTSRGRLKEFFTPGFPPIQEN